MSAEIVFLRGTALLKSRLQCVAATDPDVSREVGRNPGCGPPFYTHHPPYPDVSGLGG